MLLESLVFSFFVMFFKGFCYFVWVHSGDLRFAWLVGRLAGQLPGWLAGQLLGLLTGLLPGFTASMVFSRLAVF